MTLKTDIEKTQIQKDVLAPMATGLTEAREEKILQETGFNNVLDFNRRQRLAVDMIEKFGPAIRFEDLRKVGMRYGMVLSKPAHYTGFVGPQTALKLDAFEKAHKVDLKKNIFILCPTELSTAYGSVSAQFDATIAAEIKARKEDPVLLFKDEAGLFHIIDQWGSDMTIFRILKVALKKVHIRAINMMLSVIPALVFLTLALHAPRGAQTVFTIIVTCVTGLISFFFMVYHIIERSEGNWMPGYNAKLKRFWATGA